MVIFIAYGEPLLEGVNNFKRERYQQLLDPGFSKEWMDEITLHHAALYDNPKAKIAGLKERGFENPVKLHHVLAAHLRPHQHERSRRVSPANDNVASTTAATAQ